MKNTVRLSALFVVLCLLFVSCAVNPTIISGEPEELACDGTMPAATTDKSFDETSLFPEARLTFTACGDNIIHEAIFTDAKKRANAENPAYNFIDMYSGIADLIAKSDIAFVNMEGCVAGNSLGITGYPDFNAPTEAADTLVKLGFDVINLANNHMLDYGEKGLAGTISYFSSLPVLSIGGYTKSDYDNIRVYEKNGIKIAFLSYTTLINYSHLYDLPSSSSYIIPYAKDADIIRQVALAKKEADFVFVSMHWGTEDSFEVTSEQTRLAKLFASCGVDVVIGHHPHVIEEIDWLDRADGGKMLCVYSLGNLISTMYYSQNMLGGFVSFEIVLDKDGGKSIENVKFTPTVCHYSLSRDSLTLYKLSDYTEQLAAKHGSTLKNQFSLALLKKYLTNTIESKYLE